MVEVGSPGCIAGVKSASHSKYPMRSLQRIVGKPETIQKRAYGTRRTPCPGADKSQLAEVESPHCGRIAFALCPPRNRTAHVPSGEKPGRRRHLLQSSPFSPVRFVAQKSENTGMFAHFAGNRGGISLQCRLRGGARSLALTFLRPNSLLTGKITGNLRYFAL